MSSLGQRPHPNRRYVRVRRVDECDTLHDLLTHCLPAFGGAYLRRIYQILDRAIGAAYTPLSLDSAGRIYSQNFGRLFVVGSPARVLESPPPAPRARSIPFR